MAAGLAHTGTNESGRGTAWIGLGSNQGDGPQQIKRALELLGRDVSIQVLRTSSLYRTSPWGHTGQADFSNCVAELLVSMEPLQLLDTLMEVENRLGRTRTTRRWGPRCIDLDLLLLGNRILFLPGLTVPHSRMHRRAFVLVPLCELEPGLLIPAKGTVSACLDRLRSEYSFKVILSRSELSG